MAMESWSGRQSDRPTEPAPPPPPHYGQAAWQVPLAPSVGRAIFLSPSATNRWAEGWDEAAAAVFPGQGWMLDIL